MIKRSVEANFSLRLGFEMCLTQGRIHEFERGAPGGQEGGVKAPFAHNTGDSSKKIKDLPREINSARKNTSTLLKHTK